MRVLLAKTVGDETESRRLLRRISMVESFDVVHNILYYIYTHHITFSTVVREEEAETPKICDAEDIYGLAHRLDLDSLKSKALRFLKQTCNCKNITERVFSKFATCYEEANEVYSEFFQNHWPDVRTTSEFTKYFEDLEEEGDLTEAHRVLRRFRELMTGATFKVTGDVGTPVLDQRSPL